MKTESCTIEFVVPTTPEHFFSSWLSSEGHTLLTGAEASASPEEGASFRAWGGYIQGKNLTLAAPTHIVQSWRTLEFPDDAEDSRVELTLTSVTKGTKVSLSHTHIPEGQGKKYEQGWVTHYVEPIAKHFAS